MIFRAERRTKLLSSSKRAEILTACFSLATTPMRPKASTAIQRSALLPSSIRSTTTHTQSAAVTPRWPSARMAASVATGVTARISAVLTIVAVAVRVHVLEREAEEFRHRGLRRVAEVPERVHSRRPDFVVLLCEPLDQEVDIRLHG